MARSRCTCTFHGNDMEMTVIPGNFQDKYGQTALQIYVFHLSFPATPPMLNLAYSKIRTCPHLQRSTKQTKRLSALIHIIYHPWLKFGFRPTKLQESCPELWNLDLVSQSSMKFHIVSPISRWTFSSPLSVGSLEMLKQDISPPCTTTPSYQLVLKGPAHCCKA